MLEQLGASRIELERRDLAGHLPEGGRIDAVLDLVGNSTILDSWTCCAAAARPAWPVGWAGWSPSGISTRCCGWHPV